MIFSRRIVHKTSEGTRGLDVKFELSQEEREGKTEIDKERLIQEAEAFVRSRPPYGESIPGGPRAFITAGITEFLKNINHSGTISISNFGDQKSLPVCLSSAELCDFLASSCVKTDPLLVCPARALYEAYERWAAIKGSKPVSEVKFSLTIAAKGFTKKKKKSGNFWQGISVVVGSNDPAGLS